jgi:Arc/MetJ-type ribon-helix-helix transcriptional regulator
MPEDLLPNLPNKNNQPVDLLPHMPNVKGKSAISTIKVPSGPDGRLMAFLKGIPQGYADLATGIGNQADKLVSNIAGKEAKPVKFDIVGETEHPNYATAGEIVSAIGMPQLGAAKAAGAIPKIPDYLKALLGNVGEGAAYGVAMGGNNPDESLGKSAGIGALAGLGGSAIEGLIKAPSAKINSYVRNLANKSSPGGTKTPQEAGIVYDKIKDLIGDNKVDLGSLVTNPPLSRKYNQNLAATSGAGEKVQQNQQGLIASANKEASKIIDDLVSSSDPYNSAEAIKSAVSKLKDSREIEFSERFKNTLAQANQSVGKFNGWDKAKLLAKKKLDEEKGVVASGIKGELKSILNEVAGTKENQAAESIQDIFLNPKKYTKSDIDALVSPKAMGSKSDSKKNTDDFQEAHFSQSNIGKMAHELGLSGKLRASSVAHDLQQAMHEDIENSLKQNKNQTIYNQWLKDRNDFKNLLAPLREKSLINILQGKRGANEISKELLLDKNKSVLNQLPANVKNLIAFERLRDSLKNTGASEEPQLGRLLGEYNKLKKARKLEILTPKMQKRLDNLNALNSVLPEAKIAYNPPATGARNTKKIMDNAKILAAGGTAYMNPMAAIIAGVSKYGLDKMSEKRLTSKKLRDAYINQGVKSPNTQPYIQSLIRAIAQQAGGQQ